MYFDDYWQMWTDGAGNYYDVNMNFVGYEDQNTGEWFPDDSGAGDYGGDYGGGDYGGGDSGGGGGWAPTEPDLTIRPWTPDVSDEPGFDWQGPIQELPAGGGGFFDRVKEILGKVGKGALSVLENIQISGSGGSGPGGGGPTVAIPGKGTYDMYTGQRISPATDIMGYLPWLIAGSAALFFLSKRGR
jgi:hypothetical protein